MKGLFKLDWANVKSAIAQGIIAMILGGVLAIASYIKEAGSFIGLNWAHVLDVGAMAALGGFVTLVSIVLSLLTTDKGRLLGGPTVVPYKDY